MVSITGGIFYSRENFSTSSKLLKRNYGIKIHSPKEGTPLISPITVTGEYKVKPPDGLVIAIEYNPQVRLYWLKNPITFNPKNNSWSTQMIIGGGDNQQRTIIIAAIGESGQALFKYYKKVVSQKQDWIGIDDLPNDIKELDRITIVLNKNL